MPTRIELLKQAGFSDGEIGDWATTERQRMREAGFTDSEIDDEFGVTRPPKEIPVAFIHRILGAAREYAEGYFGDEPLGFSPENQEALRKLGVVGDIVIPVGKPLDAAVRTMSAGIAGIGAGVGQAVEEGHDAVFGPSLYGKGKAARDFAQLAQIAALLSTAAGRKPGAARAPAPKADVRNAPVSTLPRTEDFRNVAAAISGTSASFSAEQKLLRLWTDHGIPPSQVAEDALRDRTIGEAIRSESEKLPDAYVGTGETRPTAGAEPSAPAPLAESAQTDSVTVPVESIAAPLETENRSSANLNAREPALLIAARQRIRMRKPPPKPQRPFEEDYPESHLTDAQERLLHDIEGRPLNAKFVAGRRFSGKADEPLSPEDIKAAIPEAGIDLKELRDVYPDIAALYGKDLRGLYEPVPQKSGPPKPTIYLNTEPKALDRNWVRAHEFAHAIDEFSGDISKTLTPEEVAELRTVYGDLRYRPHRYGPKVQPEHHGYADAAINQELAAEGLRAYMMHPNYFKTVAPKTAAKIRALVNENPSLKRAIQFNSLLAAGLIGAGARSQDRDDQ